MGAQVAARAGVHGGDQLKLCGELGALGCAMAASVASGMYRDLQGAARHMVRVKERLEPDPQKKSAYDRKYSLFVRASQALDGLWSSF